MPPVRSRRGQFVAERSREARDDDDVMMDDDETPMRSTRRRGEAASASRAANAVKKAKEALASGDVEMDGNATNRSASSTRTEGTEDKSNGLLGGIMLGEEHMAEKLEDPRPRHHLEGIKLQRELDKLKRRREQYGKNPDEKAIRKEITDEMAQLQADYRERCKKELDDYLNSLTPLERQKDWAIKNQHARKSEQKSWWGRRPGHLEIGGVHQKFRRTEIKKV